MIVKKIHDFGYEQSKLESFINNYQEELTIRPSG